ncbi:R3H domain-containing protein 1-like [Selaginella moellendorffii]|uniref:R3H domain-containing protein 1-like n=1 Tax=Selaginella moellendorffii TaxID=88036 RepID=UPI000D1D129A|nr:R3H domain-containing protein 1-like [Selaginella moellendorffii]|eukprot:XP_024541709.1 R3H domain-containing protein 1-like [Selaginella moellendorffii]
MAGMNPPMELRSEENEDACPDSWELADLEESMKRLVPAGCSLGLHKESGGGDDDSAQIDEFLREALQNPHDRMTILRLEHDVERFVRNPKQFQLEFPPMASSYLRLAVHRVAQHYYLITSVIDSNVEGCRIIVRKSGENKFPSIRLADIPVAADGGSNSNTKFVIKQRPQASFISGGDSSGAASGSGSNASKSMEERNEEYNKARARIFRHEQEQRAYDELLEVEKRKTAKVVEVRESASTPEQGRQRMNAGSGSNSCSSSSSSSGGSGSKTDKDQSSKSRQKVAIFRDREKDRKDPDYDRNYDRYSQRFDPGFGLNQPPAFAWLSSCKANATASNQSIGLEARIPTTPGYDASPGTV